MKITTLIFCTLLSFILICCEEEEQKPVTTPLVTDAKQEEAKKYLDMFVEEAKLRGQNLDVRNVRFTFNDLVKKEGAWGLCEATEINGNLDLTFDPKKITNIIFDADVWTALNADEKQWLMFHECGHCILSRVHLNQTFDTGESASLMSQGDAGVYGGNVGFSNFKKAYYVDELFNGKQYNTNTPIPNWINIPAYATIKKKEIFREEFNDNKNNWADAEISISKGYYNLKRGSSFNNINAPFKVNISNNFEIEFELKNGGSGVLTTFSIGSNSSTKIGENQTIYQNTVVSNFFYKEKILTYLTEELPHLRLFSSLDNKIKEDAFNKITIRKIAERLYYYVNEKPVYVAPAPKFVTDSPLWFYGNTSDIYLDNVTYSVIE